ncbi:uncharacterized protein LOC107042501 [Diachasma alloeum]|uniref:uncharacterized protein LOC107042501 n=1 Tax=Diachasma alloeum TaxID=454923 RepID=UPI00073813B4|nr:uncharacterized protein LOC107042501 [Diachasma alloeum]
MIRQEHADRNVPLGYVCITNTPVVRTVKPTNDEKKTAEGTSDDPEGQKKSQKVREIPGNVNIEGEQEAAQMNPKVDPPAQTVTLAHNALASGGSGSVEAGGGNLNPQNEDKMAVPPNPTPRKLRAEEWEEEKAERSKRKKTIIIEGLTLIERKKKEELEGWLEGTLEMKARKTRQSRPSNLEGSSARVELKNRQKEVQAWIRREAENWRLLKRKVRIGYQKINGDEEDKIAAIAEGEGLGSVLDYVIAKSEEQGLTPEWFKGMRVATQEGSDHLPIFYRVKWETKERLKKIVKKGKKQKRLKWKEKKAEDFRKEWEDKWKSKEELIEPTSEERWAHIVDIIEETARKVGMTTGSRPPGWKEETWDKNGEYRNMRRKLFKQLHRFREKRDWQNKRAYITCKRELATLRDRLIKDWLKEKQAEVGTSKNLTEWWKAMNWYRKKKKENLAGKIGKERMLLHFRTLLQGEMDGGEEGREENEQKEGSSNATTRPRDTEATQSTTEEEEAEAAFDKVDRERFWKKMESMGIDGRFMEMIKEIYRCTKNEVLAGEEKTETFTTTKGVRQGCPLSPILFNIYLNDLEPGLRRRGDGGTGIGPGSNTKIFALFYADDAALIAENGNELQKMWNNLEKWSDSNLMQRTDTQNTEKAAGKTQQLVNKVWGETRRAGVTNLKRRL